MSRLLLPNRCCTVLLKEQTYSLQPSYNTVYGESSAGMESRRQKANSRNSVALFYEVCYNTHTTFHDYSEINSCSSSLNHMVQFFWSWKSKSTFPQMNHTHPYHSTHSWRWRPWTCVKSNETLAWGFLLQSTLRGSNQLKMLPRAAPREFMFVL